MEEVTRKAKEEMGKFGGNSIKILKVRNWKREYLGRQIWRRHLKKVKARIQNVTPWKITLIRLSATHDHFSYPP
jgi:hypothetical protein